MYLMNVTPVAATHTEWRTCGPPRGYSIPIFFNDSDPELSTSGAPISDKVQMIIESLRSSQSSIEMGDEMEGNSLSAQQGHPQVCKVTASVGAKSKTKGPAETQQADVCCPNSKSSDSDSDDSVDRGIEEAILEYLKEKVDHKRKAEPCFSFLQSSKMSRKTPSMAEVSKQSSDGITSNQFPKGGKAEAFPTPAVPIKKIHKNKGSLNNNMVKKLDLNKMTPSKGLVLTKEQPKSSLKTVGLFNKIKLPLAVKVEDNGSDSSSDDGIEEAIQRYQLEKKVQQSKREVSNARALKVESDSTSDDGIEEAIRCYQREQLKEKTVLKPFLQKQKPISKPLMHTVGNTSVEISKKNRLRKKKSRTDKERESAQSPPATIFIPKNPFLEGSIRGIGFDLFKDDNCKERLPPAPPVPKVNTTAELMCAEAILDISKTVMPEAFHHGVNLSSGAPTGASLLPRNYPAEESDESSIDSEDGIEQEIRKFLEQKAQMHKEPPNAAASQEPVNETSLEKVNTEQISIQNKPGRLSLTQRRKRTEENCSISNMPRTAIAVKETVHLSEGGNPAASSHGSRTHPTTGSPDTEQSGDKSSSLDSDEDLDTAIKDLLKTKKKSKRKFRDLKTKSKKHFKDKEGILGNAPQIKKFKPNPILKRSPLKKVQKGKVDSKDKSGLNKTSANASEVDARKSKATQSQASLLHKEDSSSVDSDDSIEQEIRRFLAEKAKGSTAEKDKDGHLSRNGTAALSAPLQVEDIKQENQLAEIPRKSITPLSGQSPPAPRSLPPVISTVFAQSPLTTVQSSSPGVLEPADGAGAARTDQRRTSMGKGSIQDVASQMERVQPLFSPNISHSRSESIKWRQSLGLPISDMRTPSRSQFHITSSKIMENASATPTFPRAVIAPKSQTPFTVWSSARTSNAPETTVNTTFRSPVSSPLFTARQRPRMSFTQSTAPCYQSQPSAEGERESTVHIPKDKSVFVELESNRTNHVQVQNGDQNQGKEKADLLRERKRESESLKIDEERVLLERTDEEFIDEAECESGSRRNPEKQQGLSTLSLSSAIDPGITIRPCIALTTEERSMMFSRKCTKGLHFLSRHPVQHVKRKLFFIANRRNKALDH